MTDVNNSKCSQCGALRDCGVVANSCWCQNFEAVNVATESASASSCLCESCLRQKLSRERAEHRLNFGPVVAHALSTKTMPTGALGQLQDLAGRLGVIQKSLKPVVSRCGIMVFAADHGLTDEGVSAYPKSVTWQMVKNFCAGGAAINVLAKANQLELAIVDAGVDHEFGQPDYAATIPIINRKVALGTHNSLRGPAMSALQYQTALRSGAEECLNFIRAHKLDAVGFGEMGIGNTSAASLLLAHLLDIPLNEIIGRGTGVNDAQLTHKKTVLSGVGERVALEARNLPADMARDRARYAEFIAQQCGGFEIVMMAGAMVKATDLGIPFVIDGFIATSAFVLADCLNSDATHYAVFAHRSAEAGHRKVLAKIGAQPLLDLDLRLGEGSGAALAMPLLRSAASVLSEMASFESASVSNKVVTESPHS